MTDPLQDAGLGTIGTLIYGWHYSIPNLLLLLLLAAVTLITLALIWQQRPVIPWPIAGTLMITTCAVTTLALLWTIAGRRGERAKGRTGEQVPG